MRRAVYRAMWWPTQTRRERWIWRLGYVVGWASAYAFLRRTR